MVALKDFLKTHSEIPNQFIDSFLSMYDPDTSQFDMVIESEQAAIWLGIKKFTLLKLLRTSYKQGLDYMISAGKGLVRKSNYGGNNYKYVLLTPDCFKRICMRSKSKRSEEVRTYFNQLEGLMSKYKSFIIEGVQREMAQMERALKPRLQNDGQGYVYVLKASPEKDSVYKIGRTRSIGSRMKAYATGTIDGVEILYRFKTDKYKAVERCVKALLKDKQYRKYKEVYQADIDIIKSMISGCNKLACPLKREYASTKAPIMKGGFYLWMQKI